MLSHATLPLASSGVPIIGVVVGSASLFLWWLLRAEAREDASARPDGEAEPDSRSESSD
jgi:hypothetical protein